MMRFAKIRSFGGKWVSPLRYAPVEVMRLAGTGVWGREAGFSTSLRFGRNDAFCKDWGEAERRVFCTSSWCMGEVLDGFEDIFLREWIA
jgi:hypothetical protein